MTSNSNSNDNGKILFISHDASRTGAPIILLNFLRWFKVNSGTPFQILLKNGGTLESEFKTIAPVSVFNLNKSFRNSWFTRILNRLGLKVDITQTHLSGLKNNLSQSDIGLIYTNTITNGEVLEFLSSFKCPVICHVHELGFWINHRVSPENLEQIKKYTDHYIAVSEAVKRNLVDNQGIPEEKISIVYGSVPINFQSLEYIQKQREKICEQLNISLSAKIICASGTTDWRKGPDLFIQLAQNIIKNAFDHPVYFLWIGGQKTGLQFSQLQYDVNQAGLENQVLFLGEQPNPLDFFAACDVFTLLSREDPYPLVCLEAASLGKPIICFDNAGGEPEFVEDDCGFVVPYLDIEAMAAKVTTLINSSELCQHLGANAKRKVEKQHNIEVASAQIAEIIEHFLDGRQLK